MPLCALGCDALFEQGFISVTKGYVKAGPIKPQTKDLKTFINAVAGAPCRYWSIESNKYFEWRANNFDRVEQSV
jgi:hypothetical protein